jgi:hypothetical protein
MYLPFRIQLSVFWPGVVAYSCNPSNSGGRDWENHSSRPTQAKVIETPSQLDTVSCTCHPSYAGNGNRTVEILA